MTESAQASGRVIFAAALAVALTALVVLVGLGSGDDEPALPADPECLRAWNRDPAATSQGRHFATAHQYTRAEVLRLATAGDSLEESADGYCAVVFAAKALDPEPTAAAQILVGGRWKGLTFARGATTKRLGELQAAAVGGANASINQLGLLEGS